MKSLISFSPIAERRWIIALLGGVLIVWIAFAWAQYFSFSIPAVDFSIFDHLIPNTARGRFMTSPACGDCNHFGVHSTPILFLLYPFHRLFNHPLFFVTLHVVALWSAAIPLYWLARRKWEPSGARLLLLAAFFCSPWVIKILTYQFHVEVFYVPLFLWLILFLDLRRLGPVFFVATLILLVKEDAAIYLAAFALAGGVTRKASARTVFALILGSITIFAINMHWVIPTNAGSNVYHLAGTSTRFGSSVSQAAWGMLLHWREVTVEVFKGAWLSKLYPFLFLPLLEPGFLIATLPFALIHSTALSPVMKGLSTYYSAPYIGIVFGAFVLVLGRERLPLLGLRITSQTRFFLVCLTFLVSAPAWLSVHWPRSHGETGQFQEVLRVIGPDSSVCGQGTIFPHLGYRESMALLDDACLARRMDHYVLNLDLDYWPRTSAEMQSIVRRLDRDLGYRRQDFGGFVLFSKR